MSDLIITVKAKVRLALSNTSAKFIRNKAETVIRTISFSNGIGQVLTTGQVLYETGAINVPGYHKVTVSEGKTLQDTGTFDIKISAFPTPNQAAQTINAKVDGENISIALVYNSIPLTSNIIIQTENRTKRVLTANDFITAVNDFDNDEIIAVSLSGDLTGFKYNAENTEYSSITPDSEGNRWVSISDLASNKLWYTPNDTDNLYQKTVTYKVKDFNNNISQ